MILLKNEEHISDIWDHAQNGMLMAQYGRQRSTGDSSPEPFRHDELRECSTRQLHQVKSLQEANSLRKQPD
jgi:hypothetical protein